MRTLSWLAFALTAVLAAPFASAAPRGTYIPVGPGDAEIIEPGSHSSDIVFLNRCEGGCEVNPGYDDSRTNESSIVPYTAYISEFQHSDATWDEVVRCVRGVYEPYGIVVTDVDPGQASHFEAIVAGRPGEAGMDPNVGGVAPGSCGIVNNAITFSFANLTSDVGQICWTVAQETAHAFGLDHEFLCTDPMTYLSDCGTDKTFQDVDAPCGEFSARQCYCGGSTQNSHQRILDHFGPGELSPPTVEIARPAAGAVVRPQFPVQADVVDDVEVSRVELWIDGAKIAEVDKYPYVFNAPVGLAGEVTVEIRAYDNREQEGTSSVTVTINDDLGDLGSSCTSESDCLSALCAQQGDSGLCTQICQPDDASACPDGFDCVPAGDRSVCWPDGSGGGTGDGDGGGDGGGCSVAAAGGGATWALMFLALIIRRRRRV